MFEGRYDMVESGIAPTITGTAFITAEAALILDEAAPVRLGIPAT